MTGRSAEKFGKRRGIIIREKAGELAWERVLCSAPLIASVRLRSGVGLVLAEAAHYGISHE